MEGASDPKTRHSRGRRLTEGTQTCGGRSVPKVAIYCMKPPSSILQWKYLGVRPEPRQYNR